MQLKKHIIISKELLISFLHTKLNWWIIVSSFILNACIYAFFFSPNDFKFFPKNENLAVAFFTDSAEGGNSQIIQQNISDSAINFCFKLKKGFMNPYVGINMKHKNNTFNFLPYNQLQFDIESSNINNVVVYVFTRNNYADINSSELCFSANLDITADKKHYTLPFNQLKLPEWWCSLKNISPNRKIEPDFSHVLFINIATNNISNQDINRSISIHSITAKQNNTLLLVLLSGIQLLIILILITIHYKKTKTQKKAESITINYKPITIDSENVQMHRYLEYINNNFHDTELSLENVSTQTGINKRRIANSILQQFNCNFKTYVNQIRINEAKRLLTESDLNISEISFKVGFNSPNHFNRVFKNIVGASPSEYKEANQ
jgi:AraC-like DNA-binding protein